MRRFVSEIIIDLISVGTIVLALNIQPVRSSGTIYIRADGSVEGTDDISSIGDVYYFTNTINDYIVVEKSNIVLDGANYTLHGEGGGTGIRFTNIFNVTIRNMQIEWCWYGIAIMDSSDSEISRVNITSCNGIAILFNNVSSSSILSSNIYENQADGIYLSGNSSNNLIYENNITDNSVGIQLYRAANNTINSNTIAEHNTGIVVGFPVSS